MTDPEARAMTDQPAAPTPGPYVIDTRPTGRRVFMPDDVIEIRAPQRNNGLIACLYARDWPNGEDAANAELLAASWATAAERDRLKVVNEGLVDVLANIPLSMPSCHGNGGGWVCLHCNNRADKSRAIRHSARCCVPKIRAARDEARKP